MKRPLSILGLFTALVCMISVSDTHAAAATCTAADFAAVVDQSGAQLRAFTLEAQPKLQEKMRRYQEARKLSEDEFQDAALEAIQDDKLNEFDQTSSNLLLKVDTLGRPGEGSALDCSKLDEIKAASSTLLSVMKAKFEYMLTRLDSKIADAGATAPAANNDDAAGKQAKAATTEKTEKAEKTEKTAKAETPAPPKAEAKPVEAKKTGTPVKVPDKTATAQPAKPSEPNWPTTTTKQHDAYVPPPAAPAPPAEASGPAIVATQTDGYSIDEVRDATRGFFGSISTNLASVIEYTFKGFGRPSGYVLGTEGGGAFFAGLRFGKGTLFMRDRQGAQPVYWHGPSLGSDFGASGSRTLFLIYNLHSPDALFRNFVGVDGSAYAVGGAGFTILKGGDVVMAPIRTGLGLRFGASIGYIRFTPTATWNPF